MTERYAGRRVLVLFLLLSIAWGSAFVAIKTGLAFLPPVFFAAVRFDLAGVLVLGYAIVGTDRWRPRTAFEWRVVGVGGALMIAGYQACLFIGEQATTSAVAAVIVALNPVLTTAAARLLLPEDRLGPLGIGGVLVGLAGVVVLAGPGALGALGGGPGGELLVLAAAGSFALGSVLTRRSAADLPVPTMEAWAMLVGALLLHLTSALVGESPATATWTPTAVAALLYLAVVASALGFLCYFALLERLGPVQLNLVSYVAPVVAAVVGWLLLGETVDVATAAGFLLIVAGFVIVKRRALLRSMRGGPVG